MNPTRSTWNTSRRPVALGLLALIWTAWGNLSTPAQALDPVLQPASSGGIAAVDRALARLTQNRRLLVIAAHPDDESNDLLTLVARGMGGEAAYLSLSRGDGGQNLIGTELGEGLGVLRSSELQAARSIDGAHQFFTRAYDFGYTRSLDETFERWPRRELVRDAVRVIRRFKPQVVVAIFPPDKRAGHGQHQASAIVARDAFDAAGDPRAFPELASEEGLAPWQPQAFYRFAWWDRELATHEIANGQLDPFAGRSIHQLAMESRSQHRSQDMGMLQELGSRDLLLTWEAGPAGEPTNDPANKPANDLFQDIDTSLESMARWIEAPDEAAKTAEGLRAVARRANLLRWNLTPTNLAATASELAEIVGILQQAKATTRRAGASPHFAELIVEKLTIAKEGLLAAAGIVLDATASSAALVPSGTVQLACQIWNSGPLELAAKDTTLSGPLLTASRQTGRVGTVPLEGEANAAGWHSILPGTVAKGAAPLTVPTDAPPSAPYFLARPRLGDLYDWSEVSPQVRGLPFAPAPLSARFDLRVGEVRFSVEREIVYRYRNQAVGEVRRPLRVVPRIQVAVEPNSLLWRDGEHAPRQVTVTVDLNALQAGTATVSWAVPQGWPRPEPIHFSIEAGAARRTFQIAIQPPAKAGAGRHEITIEGRIDDHAGGHTGDPTDETVASRFSYPLLDYPHIRPVPLPVAARIEAQMIDLQLPALSRIGYLRGASDRVPEALLQVGLPVELITTDDLASAELERFDAIVIGSRAYETQPAMATVNDHLLDWVRGGGLLLVQFQQYQFARGGFAPLALDIARPHGRVTDETAPVTLLQPDHPIFNTPNRLTDDDWRGWVQERGLYFAGSWDEGYTPLLSMADPGGEALRGSLLVAHLGRGSYIYTGLAFFRQLPAGIAGAFRLFANLLSTDPLEPAPGSSPEVSRP